MQDVNYHKVSMVSTAMQLRKQIGISGRINDYDLAQRLAQFDPNNLMQYIGSMMVVNFLLNNDLDELEEAKTKANELILSLGNIGGLQ